MNSNEQVPPKNRQQFSFEPDALERQYIEWLYFATYDICATGMAQLYCAISICGLHSAQATINTKMITETSSAQLANSVKYFWNGDRMRQGCLRSPCDHWCRGGPKLLSVMLTSSENWSCPYGPKSLCRSRCLNYAGYFLFMRNDVLGYGGRAEPFF